MGNEKVINIFGSCKNNHYTNINGYTISLFINAFFFFFFFLAGKHH